MHIYSSVNYALYHGECTRSKGRATELSEVEKLKLRRLQSLFSRYFTLSNRFTNKLNVIYQIGCHILDRDGLGKKPDEAIKQKSLEMKRKI